MSVTITILSTALNLALSANAHKDKLWTRFWWWWELLPLPAGGRTMPRSWGWSRIGVWEGLLKLGHTKPPVSLSAAFENRCLLQPAIGIQGVSLCEHYFSAVCDERCIFWGLHPEIIFFLCDYLLGPCSLRLLVCQLFLSFSFWFSSDLFNWQYLKKTPHLKHVRFLIQISFKYICVYRFFSTSFSKTVRNYPGTEMLFTYKNIFPIGYLPNTCTVSPISYSTVSLLVWQTS